MAFYQKYRPQHLRELVGQNFVRMTLESALKSGKIAHAYLFFGSRGTGKTSTARILAREILLSGISPENRETAEKQIAAGNFVDLIEIDGASNRKIEHARALIEKINFAPTFGTKKVYIIDEVHMLTKEAFNALLKTIEEPPPHAYFLLATTEFHKVPETIRSRCQVFTFHRFSPEEIAGRLAEIARAEGIAFEHDALLLIAKKSGGGMRDAIGLFEQSAASGKVSVDFLQKELGLVAGEKLAEFFSFLIEKKAVAAIEFVGKIAAEGHPLSEFCENFLEFLREKMLDATRENDFSAAQKLIFFIDLFDAARRDFADTPIPTLPLEIAIIRATMPENPPEKKSKWSFFAEKKPEKKEKNAEKIPENPPEKSAEIKILPLTPENFSKNWLQIVQKMRDPVARVALKNATFSVESPQKICFTFSAKTFESQMCEPARKKELLSAISAFFGDEISLEMRTKSVILEPTEPVGPSENEPATAEMLSEILGARPIE